MIRRSGPFARWFPRTSVVVVLLGCAVAPGNLAAEEAPQQSATIRLEYWASEYDAAKQTHTSTTKKMSAAVGLNAGERGYVYVGLGGFDTEATPGESAGTPTISGSVGPADAEDVRATIAEQVARVWWVEVSAERITADGLLLDVAWERLESTSPGAPRRTSRGARQIEMGSGDRHVLDHLGSGAADAVLQISAEIEVYDPFAGEALQYALWYRFRSEAGTRTRKLSMVGTHGEEAAFRFLPLRFPVTDPVSGRSDLRDVEVDLFGTVRGHRQSDGSIRVVLDATRRIDTPARGFGSTGGVSWGGVMEFVVTPGESVRVEMPPPQAGTGYGSIMANYASFFSGASDAIVFTVDHEP